MVISCIFWNLLSSNIDFKIEIFLENVRWLIAGDVRHSFILSLRKCSKMKTNVVYLRFELANLFEYPCIWVCSIMHSLFFNSIDLVVQYFLLFSDFVLNFYFSNAICWDIYVVDSVFKFARHFISMFVKRLLDDILVFSRNIWL